jgi:hypothetical protein
MNFFFVPADEKQEFEDICALLRLQAGRRVVRRLLDKSNTLGASFGGDAVNTAFNEGLRRVGLWLATRIEGAMPGELARLMQESSNDRQANATPRRKDDDD